MQRAEARRIWRNWPVRRSQWSWPVASSDWRLALSRRGNLRDWIGNPLFDRTLLYDALHLCYEVLKLALGRGERLDHCFERLVDYRGKLERLCRTEQPGAAYWFDTTRLHFSLNST